MSYFIFFNHSESKEIPDTKKIEINNVDEENQISESLDENDDKEPEVILENKEDTNKSDNKKKEESIKSSDNKKENTVNNAPIVENKKEQAVKEEKQEEVKKVTAWEELGITEYDYYNKPMWNWARIDFSIKDYKTYEKTREACTTKGEEYFKEGLGYSCTSINSYSGDYLGEMIKIF